MAGGFTDEGLAALDATLLKHTATGAVPGLAALVARDGQVHVTSAGHKALGDSAPIGRDAIFRIASMTKPVTGVAAMLLIEDGAMALSDPVERWLPELGARRVLRAWDAELSDTVPAERAITVEDVLSFRLGFGSIFTQETLPVAAAEAALDLKTLGPPWPPTPHTPDQWIAALGSLPLLDQPGERFRYNTGATVAGILIERVAGAPLAEVLSKRVFEPLGMTDTAFYVPASKMSPVHQHVRACRGSRRVRRRGRGRRLWPRADRPAGRLVRGAARTARRCGRPRLDDRRPGGVRRHAGSRRRGPAVRGIGRADGAGPDDGTGPGGEPVVLRPAPRLGPDDVGSRRRGGSADGPGRDAARLRLGGRQRHRLAHRPGNRPHRHPAHPADDDLARAHPR